MTTLSFLHTLSNVATHNIHRYGVVLEGEREWQNDLIERYITTCPSGLAFQLGGTHIPANRTEQKTVVFAPLNKGQQLLGRECVVLVCDFRDAFNSNGNDANGFDANSFSAALGALVGGGILLILPPAEQSSRAVQASEQWFTHHLSQLLTIKQQNETFPELPLRNVTQVKDRFEQQRLAVDSIKKVLTGHRKRPLVLTADRGRGKSSALGIAAAELLLQRSNCHIIVTAPNLKAVTPVFEHALNNLDGASMVSKSLLQYQHSKIEFVAADALLTAQPQCDLLLVDEAAALPLPMLKSMVSHYHRMVFSTTVHGYEGSGRGFRLKFESWLSQHRPGWQSYRLEQPIRWNNQDPLEQWLFDAFLLNAEISDYPAEYQVDASSLQWHALTSEQLLANPHRLRECFALLVNAHYQTSPNDLIQLLDNPDMTLYELRDQSHCIGCVLTVKEGNLDSDLVSDIQTGRRRPKGHLAPSLIANHLGVDQAATQACLRVMRIAVHPKLQARGLGSFMIQQLCKHLTNTCYIATSFGATAELVEFWSSNDFLPVHLGHNRDQASGCHSLLMLHAVQGNSELWVEECNINFEQNFRYLMSSSFSQLEPNMLKALLAKQSSQSDNPLNRMSDSQQGMINRYSLGGNAFDSVAYIVESLLCSLNKSQFSHVSDLLIWKVLLKKDWGECARLAQLTGRKQVEETIRVDLAYLMLNLQCK